MRIRFSHDPSVAVALLLATACSDASTDFATETRRALCDGSDEVRLTFVSEGGGLQPAGVRFQWATYGASFFMIDGGCHYWTGGGLHTGVVRSGTLDAQAARDISSKLHFDELPALAANPPSPGCGPDASSFLLGTGGRVVRSCLEDGHRSTTIIRIATDVQQDLFSSGTPYEGPLRALVLPIEDAPVFAPPNPWVFPWPLSWSPATIAGGQGITATSGRPIDDEMDRRTLRALRATIDERVAASAMFFRTTDRALFEVYLRDEPPLALLDALASLISGR